MGMPHDALAPYPWSCGLGCYPAEGYETEISAAPWALRLGKGLYFTLLFLLEYAVTR